jgi:hypothetical protein
MLLPLNSPQTQHLEPRWLRLAQPLTSPCPCPLPLPAPCRPPLLVTPTQLRPPLPWLLHQGTPRPWPRLLRRQPPRAPTLRWGSVTQRQAQGSAVPGMPAATLKGSAAARRPAAAGAPLCRLPYLALAAHPFRLIPFCWPQAVASAISEGAGQTVDPASLTGGNANAVSNAINQGTGGGPNPAAPCPALPCLAAHLPAARLLSRPMKDGCTLKLLRSLPPRHHCTDLANVPLPFRPPTGCSLLLPRHLHCRRFLSGILCHCRGCCQRRGQRLWRRRCQRSRHCRRHRHRQGGWVGRLPVVPHLCMALCLCVVAAA